MTTLARPALSKNWRARAAIVVSLPVGLFLAWRSVPLMFGSADPPTRQPTEQRLLGGVLLKDVGARKIGADVAAHARDQWLEAGISESAIEGLEQAASATISSIAGADFAEYERLADEAGLNLSARADAIADQMFRFGYRDVPEADRATDRRGRIHIIWSHPDRRFAEWIAVDPESVRAWRGPDPVAVASGESVSGMVTMLELPDLPGLLNGVDAGTIPEATVEIPVQFGRGVFRLRLQFVYVEALDRWVVLRIEAKGSGAKPALLV